MRRAFDLCGGVFGVMFALTLLGWDAVEITNFLGASISWAMGERR